jgi:hypothetical protein
MLKCAQRFYQHWSITNYIYIYIQTLCNRCHIDFLTIPPLNSFLFITSTLANYQDNHKISLL